MPRKRKHRGYEKPFFQPLNNQPWYCAALNSNGLKNENKAVALHKKKKN